MNYSIVSLILAISIVLILVLAAIAQPSAEIPESCALASSPLESQNDNSWFLIIQQLLAIYGETTNRGELFNYLNSHLKEYLHEPTSTAEQLPLILEGLVQVPRTRSITKDFLHEDLIKIVYEDPDVDRILSALDNNAIISKYSIRPYIKLILDEFFKPGAISYSYNALAFDYIMIQHYRQPILLLRNIGKVPLIEGEERTDGRFEFLEFDEKKRNILNLDNFGIPISSQSSLSLFLELTTVKQTLLNQLSDTVKSEFSKEKQRIVLDHLAELQKIKESALQKSDLISAVSVLSLPLGIILLFIYFVINTFSRRPANQ